MYLFKPVSQGILTGTADQEYLTKTEVLNAWRKGKTFRVTFKEPNQCEESQLCTIKNTTIDELVKLKYNHGKSVVFYTITPQDFVINN